MRGNLFLAVVGVSVLCHAKSIHLWSAKKLAIISETRFCKVIVGLFIPLR